MNMNRAEALEIVRKYIPQVNLVKHMIACGACMKDLAARLGADTEKWELAGLLHDIDLDETAQDFARHGLVTVERLRAMGFGDEEALGAILAHAEKKPVKTTIERALYAIDPTTGFIVACALMHPTRKLSGLDLDFLRNRFREKRFAAGASREQIASCESMGLSLDEFLSLCLKAMQSVSAELGL